jgi:hypothetical protein
MIETDSVEAVEAQYRREAVFGLCYFAAYLAYLFLTTENEAMHWGTLVLLPFFLLYLLQRRSRGTGSLRQALSTVGIARGNLRRGLLWAALVGRRVHGEEP